MTSEQRKRRAPSLTPAEVAARCGLKSSSVNAAVRLGTIPPPDWYQTNRGGHARPRWYISTIDNFLRAD